MCLRSIQSLWKSLQNRRGCHRNLAYRFVTERRGIFKTWSDTRPLFRIPRLSVMLELSLGKNRRSLGAVSLRKALPPHCGPSQRAHRLGATGSSPHRWHHRPKEVGDEGGRKERENLPRGIKWMENKAGNESWTPIRLSLQRWTKQGEKGVKLKNNKK